MRRLTRPAALLAIALIGSAAFVGVRRVWPPSRSSDVAALAAAVGSSLPFESRLSGGFVPSDRHATRGAGLAVGDALSPDVRIAVAQLEKRAAAESSPQTLAALGVSYLVSGDVDKSVSTLEDAATQGDAATAWSDLSAAYLAKAERMPARRVEYDARALEAATKSLRLSPSNEARFNRALAIDGLTPFVGQTNPWVDYLSAERDARWIEAAKRHAADDPPVADARGLWEERKRQLRERPSGGDRAFIDGAVAEFPEASMEFFEQELLVEWADGNGQAFDLAQRLATSVFTVTSDPMLRDEIAAIKSSGRLLAEAHKDYAEGLRYYDADDNPRAKAAFARALAGFVRVDSPYRSWVVIQYCLVLFHDRDLAEADRRLALAESTARSKNYQTMLGRVLWVRGLVFAKQWRLQEALEAFHGAEVSFRATGEREYAVSIYGYLADSLRTLGERHESWEYLGRTLEGLSRVRKPTRRYLSLYNASLFASSQDLVESGLLFQNAAVREAAMRPGKGTTIEALTQRALLLGRRREFERARRDLDEATALIDTQPDGHFKRGEQAEVALASAELGDREHRPVPVDRLQRALTFFEQAEPAMVPRLNLSLARAKLAAGDAAGAQDTFAQGISSLEGQQARLDDDAFRISYFDDAWSLFPEMISLQIGIRRDPARAFEFAERSRARSLLAGTQPIGLREVQQRLPPSTVLLYYASLSDRLLIWAVTGAAVNLVEVAVQRDDLSRLISRFRSDLTEGRDRRQINDRLHRLLIRPVAASLALDTTIVFSPDGDLQRLPFATLLDPATGRYLVEDHPLLMAPSASFFAAGLERAKHFMTQPLTSALLVGNPDGDGLSSQGTRSLPGAESEVAVAAKFYASHTVLTGQAATKRRFLQVAPDYDVVHFGGHAYPNVEYPLLSRLSFSGGATAEEQQLFAYEIARLKFSRTRLVVLAACSTAVGAMSRGEGVVSVARPFLAAGVPIVVASQWDVDDRATQQLFVAFHLEFARSGDPLQSLRAAQLSLLRSKDPFLASPVNWGAFVVLGTAAR
jgi:CHAT domain-containing protein/tetratricopeptide (TPR) repeat protein